MRRPVVVWTALFALGVVLQGFMQGSLGAWLLLVGAAGAATVWIGQRGGAYGIVVALVIVAAGGWWHASRQLSLHDALDEFIDAGPVLLRGVVAQMPESAPERAYYVLRLMEAEGVPTSGNRTLLRLTVADAARYDYGDVVQVRAVLQRPGPASNPGAFDYEAYLHRQGITVVAFVPYPRHVVKVGRRSPNPLLQWAAAVRRATLRGLAGAFPEDTEQLLAGIALGRRRGLAEGVEDDFRRAGISHLLAVSGMHVGFLAVAAGALLRLLRVPRPVAVLLAIGFVWTYVLVTGARPPAVRAGVAGSFGLAAHGMDELSDTVTALAAAALILIVQNPLVVYDVSFQLSFVATGAIVVGFVPLRDSLHRAARPVPAGASGPRGDRAYARHWKGRRLPKPMAAAVALAVAAQWGVLPLVARVFYEVSTVGLLAGLLAAPLVALLVPAGLGTAWMYNVWPWAARAPASAVHSIARLLTAMTQWFSGLPWAYVSVPRPTPAFIASVWIFGLLIARGKDWSPRRRRQVGALIALLLVVALWGSLFAGPARLELVAIDVGQGDALFVRTPTGATALVDGGGVFRPMEADATPNTGSDIIVPYLRYRGLRRVDVVVNTHPHEDHVQGLLPILSEWDVRLALDSGQTVASPSWRSYKDFIMANGIVRHVAAAGDVIWLDEDTRLEVLHPRSPLMQGTRSDLNNNSVVLRLVYKKTAALLTGDIETEAQLRLLREGADLRAQVVKIPHHGSRLGLVTGFYEAVGADVAVITVGRNNYGHPSEEVIGTVQDLGTAVYRTDVHGAVILMSDGKRWTVKTTLGGR